MLLGTYQLRTRYLCFIFVPWLFLKWSSHGIMFSCNNHQQQPMPEVQYGKGIGLTKAPENSDTHTLSAEEGLYRFCPWIAHTKIVSQISSCNGTLFKKIV